MRVGEEEVEEEEAEGPTVRGAARKPRSREVSERVLTGSCRRRVEPRVRPTEKQEQAIMQMSQPLLSPRLKSQLIALRERSSVAETAVLPLPLQPYSPHTHTHPPNIPSTPCTPTSAVPPPTGLPLPLWPGRPLPGMTHRPPSASFTLHFTV